MLLIHFNTVTVFTHASEPHTFVTLNFDCQEAQSLLAGVKK